MSSRNDSRNEKAIKRGLDWLSRRRDEILRRGMIELLQEAAEYSIHLHDSSHFGHRTTRDTHGWALVKNGKIEYMQVNDGNHGEGDASEQLRDAAGKVKPTGYVGIVLASFSATREDGRPIIFEIEYEVDVMNATIGEIKRNFHKFFKPVK